MPFWKKAYGVQTLIERSRAIPLAHRVKFKIHSSQSCEKDMNSFTLYKPKSETSCFAFGVSCLVIHYSRRVLGEDYCSLVVLDSTMPTPYSQDLSWRVIWFMWNLGLTREEVAFLRDISTWNVERYPRGDTRIKRSLFYSSIVRGSTQTKP